VARIIAVTGIDGSGKTTTAKNLLVGLQEAGYSAVYKHQFDSAFSRTLNALKRMQLSKVRKVSSVAERLASADTTPRKPAKLKIFAAYTYLLVQAIGANRARFSKTDFVVFDRYFYDDFVRFRQRYHIAEDYFYFVEKLVPRPTLVVTLDGDVQTTYDRQVDIDSSYEKYVEKLEIHKATIEKLALTHGCSPIM
jgi:thymidylate kinase